MQLSTPASLFLLVPDLSCPALAPWPCQAHCFFSTIAQTSHTLETFSDCHVPHCHNSPWRDCFSVTPSLVFHCGFQLDCKHQRHRDQDFCCLVDFSARHRKCLVNGLVNRFVKSHRLGFVERPFYSNMGNHHICSGKTEGPQPLML